MESVTYPMMGVDHTIVNDQLFIDSMGLINHLAVYFYTLRLDAIEEQNRDMAVASETVRNLALFLLEAHDLALAEYPEILGAELDKLLFTD